MEYEEFIDDIKMVNGCMRLTIPSKLVKFMGLEEGFVMKVKIKRVSAFNEYSFKK